MTDSASPAAPDPVPDWAALARLATHEPAVDDAARVRDAAARAWLAEHPDEAARLEALDRVLGETPLAAVAQAPAVDVDAALARVRRTAGLERPATVGGEAGAEAPEAPRLTVVRGGTRSGGARSGGARSGGARSGGARTPSTSRSLAAPVRRAPAWRRAGALLAASVALAAGVTWYRSQVPDSAGGAGAVAAAGALHRVTGVGERQVVRLADGSQVVLGPASTLDVAADFGQSARRVRLSGEGYFRAVHDPRRPFEVAAGDAVVRDIGTAFVVRAPARAAGGAPGAAVDVAVTEGAVRLRTASPAGGAADAGDSAGVLLRAGDRGRVLAAAGAAAPTVAVLARGTDVAADTAWTAGRLVFRDAPLTAVAGELRRWYGVELRFADPALADRHLTATFAGESADAVLRVVGLATGARLERRGDTVVVRAAGGAPAR